jgi:hypothetical protein
LDFFAGSACDGEVQHEVFRLLRGRVVGWWHLDIVGAVLQEDRAVNPESRKADEAAVEPDGEEE